MRLFDLQYGVRVTAHDKHPFARDFVKTWNIREFRSEHNLLTHAAHCIPWWTDELRQWPGRPLTEEGLTLAQLAADNVLAAFERLTCVGKPWQLHFEDDDDYGTVNARVWLNVTHSANRAHKITREALSCTP